MHSDYKFLWIDVGANGSMSDSSLWNTSDVNQALIEDTLSLPDDEALPNDDRLVSELLPMKRISLITDVPELAVL